jgi:hypothetical protein
LRSTRILQETGETCTTHGRDGKCVQNYSWSAWKEETALNTYI